MAEWPHEVRIPGSSTSAKADPLKFDKPEILPFETLNGVPVWALSLVPIDQPVTSVLVTLLLRRKGSSQVKSAVRLCLTS